MCLTYSTVGLRPDCDFLLWRIGQPAPTISRQQTKAINKTRWAATSPRRGRSSR